MATPEPPLNAPQRRLSLFDAVAIIVGIIVGAGIFETAATVADAAGSARATLFLWVAGGVISLIGALCYAELRLIRATAANTSSSRAPSARA